jgi:hypothetical protein
LHSHFHPRLAAVHSAVILLSPFRNFFLYLDILPSQDDRSVCCWRFVSHHVCWSALFGADLNRGTLRCWCNSAGRSEMVDPLPSRFLFASAKHRSWPARSTNQISSGSRAFLGAGLLASSLFVSFGSSSWLFSHLIMRSKVIRGRSEVADHDAVPWSPSLTKLPGNC